MGKLLFGKPAGGSSQRSAESGNLAYPYIKDTFGGVAEQAGGATSLLSSLLGAPGSDPSLGEAGFQRYKNLGGFDFMNERGQGGIVANRAAGGLLRSGGSSKALAQFTSGLQNTYLNNYMDQAQGLGGLGIQGGQLITQAGQYSKDESSSTERKNRKPGLLEIGASIAASDRRLKDNIVELCVDEETGLTVYEYEYKTMPGIKVLGVMAEEVEEKMPEALGPVLQGYKTVDYGIVWGLE